jgi:hypothetical protein
MADTTNDNEATSKQPALTADDRSSLVIQVEDMIGGYSREDVLCILLTVTVNAFHVVEEKGERKRVGEEYIKVFRFLSAVEEQFQAETPDDPPDWVEQCTAKMMRHVFRAIGLGIEIPE